MTRRRSPQNRKDSEIMTYAADLQMDADITKMSEMEFRLAIVKTMARMEKSINGNIESLRAEMKAELAELKNAINEIQSNLDNLTARVTETEERISDLEDSIIDKKGKEEAREKQLRIHENRIREISDTMKRSNVRIIGIPEGVERERGLEDVFEQIVAENFPNLGNETNIRVLEAERTPPKIKENRPTPRHVIVKLANLRTKETILRAVRGKRFLTYRGRNIRITSDLSTETWQARKAWQDIFRVLNEKNMQPRILYPARLSFRMDGEMQSFQDQQKLKEYVTTKPALQEILRGVL